MEENNRNNKDQIARNPKTNQSIGNQQDTTMTGAQNNGGENIDQQNDQYTEDLRESGDRSSSNRKENG
jgi:hypothetical protein